MGARRAGWQGAIASYDLQQAAQGHKWGRLRNSPCAYEYTCHQHYAKLPLSMLLRVAQKDMQHEEASPAGASANH